MVLIAIYQYNYKQLTLLTALTSAPDVIKHSTINKLSFNAAACNGVHCSYTYKE